MVQLADIDIEKLIKEGGDIYQKLADKLNITRYAARLILFPYLYGKRTNGK